MFMYIFYKWTLIFILKFLSIRLEDFEVVLLIYQILYYAVYFLNKNKHKTKFVACSEIFYRQDSKERNGVRCTNLKYDWVL